MTRTLVRLAAVFAIAACTAGCSTISDLMGDDTSDAAPAADASGFPPDTAPTNADGTKPDLAAIPDKPTGTTSPDAQRATTDSLAADAARSHYSSDALRGGTEAAAAPPPRPSPGARDFVAAGRAARSTCASRNTSTPCAIRVSGHACSIRTRGTRRDTASRYRGGSATRRDVRCSVGVQAFGGSAPCSFN